MKEMKFRAWHTTAKTMLNCHDQGYQGEVFKWLHEKQPIEIMQFTGLCDNNGNDIYEGDIVSDDCGNRGTIVWEQFSAQYLVVFDGEAQDLDTPSAWAEIVGNIYEGAL